VLTRLLFGARTSLGLAFTAALAAMLAGAALGGLAAFAGGALDEVVLRATDFVMVLPTIYVVLALRAVLPLVLTGAQVFALLAGIFAIVGAPFVARGVRAIVRSEKRLDYASAAQALGASDLRLLVRHLLPAARGFMAVQITLLVPAFIVAEATLSYVGLGFPDQVASWGTMLHDASSNIRVFADFPWLLSPAAAMFLVVLGVNLVLRGAPLYQWLRQAIAAGELGEIYAIDGDYLYGRLHKITDGWRSQVADYSVMQGGGVHLVDLMLWLTGQRPVSATAAGNRIATSGTAFRGLDFMAATFQFDSGLVGRVTANFGCVHPHQHVLRVFGTRATFLHDDRGARLHSSRDPLAAVRSIDLAALPPSKGVLIPDFVASILDGASAGAAQQEFDLISVCLAADRAAAAGASQKVEYV